MWSSPTTSLIRVVRAQLRPTTPHIIICLLVRLYRAWFPCHLPKIHKYLPLVPASGETLMSFLLTAFAARYFYLLYHNMRAGERESVFFYQDVKYTKKPAKMSRLGDLFQFTCVMVRFQYFDKKRDKPGVKLCTGTLCQFCHSFGGIFVLGGHDITKTCICNLEHN